MEMDMQDPDDMCSGMLKRDKFLRKRRRKGKMGLRRS